ncbi:hypothetical protein Rs2_15941 [Raphanus sativus]|nr:hypothetical protein Rs2_15941 [Raphanus sativus]
MANRYDPNPFAEEEEVNPFAPSFGHHKKGRGKEASSFIKHTWRHFEHISRNLTVYRYREVENGIGKEENRCPEIELEASSWCGRKRIRVRVRVGSVQERKISSKKLSSASCQSGELEDLHLDILVRIICGVEHEDLKQLFHVSKTVREATLIAKQLHFAYSTPRKTSVFQHSKFGLDKPFGLGDGYAYEIEAPGAPLQKRYRFRNKDDSGVSVALFK